MFDSRRAVTLRVHTHVTHKRVWHHVCQKGTEGGCALYLLLCLVGGIRCLPASTCVCPPAARPRCPNQHSPTDTWTHAFSNIQQTTAQNACRVGSGVPIQSWSRSASGCAWTPRRWMKPCMWHPSRPSRVPWLLRVCLPHMSPNCTHIGLYRLTHPPRQIDK